METTEQKGSLRGVIAAFTNAAERKNLVKIFKFIGKAFIWLSRQPSAVDKWRRTIGMNEILIWVAQAEAFKNMSGEAKNAYVAKRISLWAKSRGFGIPASVVSYLIEEALQIFLKQSGMEPYAP
jgi:hypothetical protein